jgi:hypothetical protein
MTTTGRLVSSGPSTGSEPLPPSHIDAITSLACTAARLPALAFVADGSAARSDAAATYTVFEVDRSRRRGLSRWLIAVAGKADSWPMSTADAIGELAAIAAIDQSGRVGERTTTRSIADAAFPLLTVDDTARTEVYLGQLGIDLDAPAIVVAAGLLRGSRPDEDLRLALEDAIAPLAEPVVGIGSAGEALALVQPRPGVSDADVFESLTTSLRRIGPGLRRDRLTVGVSMRATIASIGGGVRTARSVRQLAVDERQPVEVVADSDLHTTRLLLNAVPDILRMAFVDRVLGPVISYDGRGTGDLLPTLATFFECNSSWSRTADRLGLHINTVRYRLARIEQLTGRTIAQSDDWVDLYAALTLRRSAG